MYSVDVNFRMNCKMRPEPRPDLPLYNGLGVQMPTEMYHDWLCQYITEEDVRFLDVFEVPVLIHISRSRAVYPLLL